MGTPCFDPIVLTLTKPLTWIPFYIFLVALLWRRMGWRKTLLVLLSTAICVLLADQMASGICKPFFHRLRPTHEPALEGIIRIVHNYRGGRYGFFSSHAANTCAIATFISLIYKRRFMTGMLITYAFINCWTRLYLGVHYFGDIIVGVVWGMLIGWIINALYTRAEYKLG